MDPPAPSVGRAQDTPGPSDAGGHTSATARAVSEMHSPYQHLQTDTTLYSEDPRDFLPPPRHHWLTLGAD